VKTARLIFAASAQDANLLYATGLIAPDSFLWFETGRQELCGDERPGD